jgi:hypothetical protein
MSFDQMSIPRIELIQNAAIANVTTAVIGAIRWQSFRPDDACVFGAKFVLYIDNYGGNVDLKL